MGWSSRRNNIVIILLIVLIAMIFRRYDALAYPRLWAEDGRVFLQQYEQFGIKTLVMPYAGYHLALLRIIALVIGILQIDLAYIPAAYNTAAFLIASGLALYLYKCAGLIGLRHRLVFATCFLFIPLDSEIYMNLTNGVWFIQMMLVAYVFVGHFHEPASGRWTIAYYAKLLFILIISLTGPGSLILSPIIVLIIILERKELSFKKLLPLLLVLAGGVVQLLSIKYSGTNTARTVKLEHEEPYHLLKFFTLNIKETFFLHKVFDGSNTHHINEMIITAVAGLLLIVIFVVIYRKANVARKYVPLLAAILFTASFIIAFWPNAWKVLALNSPRYYFIPYTCIMLIAVISLDKKLKPVYIAAYLAFFSFHSEKIAFVLQNKSWGNHVLLYKAGLENSIPINPDGWDVVLPPKQAPVAEFGYTTFDSTTWFGEGEKLVAMWGNGLLQAKEVVLPKGEYTLSVIIRGYSFEGIYPHHNVYINGAKVGDMYIYRDFKTYTFPFTLEQQTPVTTAIDMDNDGSGDGEDRNSFMFGMYIHEK